jgi:hypothetical protein
LVYHEYGKCFNLDRYKEAKSLLLEKLEEKQTYVPM